MIASNMGSAPAEPLKKKHTSSNCGPMTQQRALGAHGDDMHPQEFIRLIGCSDTHDRESGHRLSERIMRKQTARAR